MTVESVNWSVIWRSKHGNARQEDLRESEIPTWGKSTLGERGQGLGLRAPEVSAMRQELQMEEEWLGFLSPPVQPCHQCLVRRNTSSEDSELIFCEGKDKRKSPPNLPSKSSANYWLLTSVSRDTEPIWNYAPWHWNLLQDGHWMEKDCNLGQPHIHSVG